MTARKKFYLMTAKTYCMMSGDGKRERFLAKAKDELQKYKEYTDEDITDPYSFKVLHLDLWGDDDKQAA